jgi:hypothetical protein
MPLLTIAMADVPAADAGRGSGITNVSLRISGAFGRRARPYTAAANQPRRSPRTQPPSSQRARIELIGNGVLGSYIHVISERHGYALRHPRSIHGDRQTLDGQTVSEPSSSRVDAGRPEHSSHFWAARVRKIDPRR